MNSKKDLLINYRLTSYQQDIWLKHAINPGNPLCNIGASVEITGPFDYEKLNYSINRVIADNDALRLYIEDTEGKPYQGFKPEIKYEALYYDISDHADCKQLAKKWMQDRFLVPFELDKPLFDFALLKIDHHHFYFFTKAHHIIADGWGLTLINQKIVKYYNDIANENIETESFISLIESDSAYIKSKSYIHDIEFWTSEYKNIPETLFTTKDIINVPEKITSKRTRYLIKREKYNKIMELCNNHGCTEFHYFLGIIALYFGRLYNKDEIIIDVPVLNRNKKERDIVGHCVNNIPLSIKISPTESFISLIKEIKIQLSKCYRHYKLSYGQICRELKLGNRRLSDLSLSFDIHDTKVGYANVETKSSILSHQHEQYALFMLVHAATANEDAIIYLDYSLDIFDSNLPIENVLSHLQAVTNDTLKNPEKLIKNIEILTEKEKHQLLIEWNETIVEYPKNKCIHQLFEEQVLKTQDDTALIFEGIKLTYLELNEKANIVAHYLKDNCNTKPGDFIGILLSRSEKMIISILGVLKASCAYIPIDAEYPKDRINYILEDSMPKAVIANEERGLYLDINKILKTEKRKTNPAAIADTSLPIYIIYTSGSTGKPKGTLISHRNFVNYISWAKAYYLNEKVRGNFGLFSSISFDLTTTSIFLPLLNGKNLEVFNQKDEISELLSKIFQSKSIDCVKLTPSHISLLSNLEIKGCQINLVIVGGEELLNDHVKTLKALNKDIKIVNEYGPTEATVGCIVKEIKKDNERILIGKPIGNTQIYLLNNSELVPVGVPGEIHISGESVVQGYYKRPELNEDKFINNPFNNDPRSRLYKTGDLAKYLPNGDIQFLGRIDGQLKINGYRIEPGEIESVLNNQEGISTSVVLGQKDKSGNKRLVAYIVTTQASLKKEKRDEINIEKLRESLSKILPAYMVPALFVKLEAMPLTPNGKIDKKALPDPNDSIETTNGYVAPSGKIEKLLAEIWRDVLGINRNIGIDDRYFEMGGDSIKAIQIMSRLKQKGLKAEVASIFKAPTIRELALLIKEDTLEIDQSLVVGSVALTPIQKWFFCELDCPKEHYNQKVMLEFKGALNSSALKQAFRELLNHHDALRMSFKPLKGVFAQENRQNTGLYFEEFDLSNEKEPYTIIEQKTNSTLNSFSLENDTLIRFVYFNLGNTGQLFIVVHHLVIDGVSWRILLEDIETAYKQASNMEKITLPLKTTSFKIWSEKLNEYANSDEFKNETNYWAGIHNLEMDPLPDERSKFDNKKESSAIILDKTITDALLTKTNHAYTTEINDLLLTALVKTITQWTGKDQVKIDLESHGRTGCFKGIDCSRTVGWFTSLFPVFFDLANCNILSDIIIYSKEQINQIQDNGIGYGVWKYLSNNFNFPTNSHTSEILFNYLGQFSNATNDGLFQLVPKYSGATVSPLAKNPYKLSFNGIIEQGIFKLTLESEIYSNETLDIILGSYKKELLAIISHCEEQKESVKTPSNFTLNGIQIEEYNKLLSDNKISPSDVQDIYDLTPMQEGFLFHSKLDSNSSVSFEQFSLHIKGQFNIDLFKESWELIIKKHDVLRTIFISNFRKPIQLVLKNGDFEFSYLNICNKADKKQIIKQEEIKDRSKKFELNKGPLFRLKLIEYDIEEYLLLLSFNHIILDGWCVPLLFAEFQNNYIELLNGYNPSYIELAPFSKYISWFTKQNKELSDLYWRNYLKDFKKITKIPTIDFEVSKDTEAQLEYRFSIDEKLSSAIQQFSNKLGVTITTFIQTLWGVILSKYNDTNDIVFGATVSGRPKEIPGVDKMIGIFINTIPVRIKTDNHKKFNDLLQEVQLRAIEGLEHHYYPLIDIQNSSQLNNSLFDHILVVENYPLDKRIMEKNSSSTQVESVNVFGQINYDFGITIFPSAELEIKFSYNPTIYNEAVMKIIASNFGRGFDQVIANEDIIIEDLEIFANNEKELLKFPETIPPQHFKSGIEEASKSNTCYEPKNKIEKNILGLCKNILSLESIGPYDDFFEKGMTSILLMKFYSTINELYPDIVTVQDLFDYRNIDGLCGLIIKKIAKNPKKIINEIEF